MKEGTSILQHLNIFDRILSDLLVLEIKLEEENNALLLLSSLTTTIIYGKETLELEDVRQMLLNNELMKKTNSTKGPQDWLSRARGKDQ